MLDIKYIRENPKLVNTNCKNRGVKVDIDILLGFDEEIRQIKTELQGLQEERNKKSKTKPTDEEIIHIKKVGEAIKILESKLNGKQAEFLNLINQIPNLTHPDVKISKHEDDNPVMETFGKPTEFNFKPKDHVKLATDLDLIDLDRAAKVTGNKFYYFKNELTIMELALLRYTLDVIMKYGYTPITTPDLARTEVVQNMGFNPRGESTQIYNIQDTDLSLIGTAEITLGGYHLDEILDIKELPKKYVAISHCFRTEAGSYSKFSKGIFRVHQFTKVEMFVYSIPEKSEAMHAEMLEIEKEIFKGLGIPFRIVDHSTADLGTPASRTFDLEGWLPGKPNQDGKNGDWAELTSTSNCTDYQARSMNIKYRDGKKNELVHTLNGTGIAIPRAIIAILENYQQADGSITIPKVLKKYMNLKKIKAK
ncbi:MAG: serine--tRNA ligase [bacterium]